LESLQFFIMRIISFFLTLMGFWWLISWQSSAQLLIIGTICCLAVTILSAKLGIIDMEGHPIEKMPRFGAYMLWLLWEILLANIDVVKVVWHPRMPIQPKMFTAPNPMKSGFGSTLYANSITLTPGTVTVSIDKRDMLIHALTESSESSLLEGAMGRKCRWVEGRV
jgi:multicomponent Na+:H+ antiporter subunit E